MKGDSLEAADNFAMLIAVSGATLLIGGAVMMIPGMEEAINQFAITLGLFVLGISAVYAGFSRIVKKALPSAMV